MYSAAKSYFNVITEKTFQYNDIQTVGKIKTKTTMQLLKMLHFKFAVIKSGNLASDYYPLNPLQCNMVHDI